MLSNTQTLKPANRTSQPRQTVSMHHRVTYKLSLTWLYSPTYKLRWCLVPPIHARDMPSCTSVPVHCSHMNGGLPRSQPPLGLVNKVVLLLLLHCSTYSGHPLPLPLHILTRSHLTGENEGQSACRADAPASGFRCVVVQLNFCPIVLQNSRGRLLLSKYHAKKPVIQRGVTRGYLTS